jgi:hypothetical protein
VTRDELEQIEKAEAAILAARQRIGFMHHAMTADRKAVRDALDEALAALATTKAP